MAVFPFILLVFCTFGQRFEKTICMNNTFCEKKRRCTFLKMYALVFCFVTLGNITRAQDTLRGMLMDTNGVALIAASIAIEGTTIGTFTEMDGSWILPVPPNIKTDLCKLEFSYAGFETQLVLVDGQREFNIQLVPDKNYKEKVVYLGPPESVLGRIRYRIRYRLWRIRVDFYQKMYVLVNGKSYSVYVVDEDGNPLDDITILVNRGVTTYIYVLGKYNHYFEGRKNDIVEIKKNGYKSVRYAAKNIPDTIRMAPLDSSEVALEQAQTSGISTKCLDTLTMMHDTNLTGKTIDVTVNGEIAEVPEGWYSYEYEGPSFGGKVAYQKNDNLTLLIAMGVDFSFYSKKKFKSLYGSSIEYAGGIANRDLYKNLYQKGKRGSINENDTIGTISWKVYYGYNIFSYKNFLFTPYLGIGLFNIYNQHSSRASIYCSLMEVGCDFDCFFTKTSHFTTLKPYYSVLYNKSLGVMPIIGVALLLKATD